MKSKITLPFLLLFFNHLVAQEVITTEVQDSFKAPQYEVVYDDVFLSKKETKSLFKVDLTANVGVAFEQKLNKEISLDFSLGFISTIEKSRFFDGYTPRTSLALGIEPRWYMNKTQKESVNNLNGNYIGVKGLYTVNFFPEDGRNNWGILASYGMQRRIFNRWYADYQIGLGAGKLNLPNYIGSNADINYWLHNKFTIGLSFGNGKKSPTSTCDLFNCFEEENSLWKLDLRRIFSEKFFGFSISLNPEYERKLGKSPFSINIGLDLAYSNSINGGFALGGSVEPRYYYNLKKRIARGKSANNLSGNYIALNIQGNYSNYDYIGYLDTNARVVGAGTFFGPSLSIEPRFGIQRRLFKNGFLDISFSPIHIQKSFITFDERKMGTIVSSRLEPFREGLYVFKITDTSIPMPQIQFKVGFAF